MINNQLTQIIRKFIGRHRQYCFFNERYMMFDKKTCNGLGSINFLRVYFDDKLIVINGTMMNRFDYNHLKELVGEICACFGPFTIAYKEYHYPIYYRKSLNRDLNDYNINEKLNKYGK